MSQNQPERTPEVQATDDAPAKTQEERDESERELSLDVTFEVLKNARRRRVLHYLQNESESTTLSNLAEHLAAIENNKDRSQLDSQERKRVYVGLYQCHLPKMDDTDVVEFDDDRGTVELGPNADDVYQYLEAGTGDDEPVDWAKYYAGYSVAGALVTAALLFLGTPLVQTIGVGVVLVGLLALAGAHYLAGPEDD